jgi:predicted NBD/HSP70 family sugar kinase
MMLAMIDHPAWEALRVGIANAITNNLPEWLIFIGALAIASVVTMPEMIPQSAQDLWTWFRNALQTAVPAARARHEASSSVVTTTPTASTKQEAQTSTAVDPTPPTLPTAPVPPKEGE